MSIDRMETDLFRDVRAAFGHAKRTGTMTPHLRILNAARLGHGVRLSPEEVDELARDEALVAGALHDALDTMEATDAK